jgi:hypothetical protein
MKARPKPEPVALSFKGLEWCDGCRARLEPGDQFAGLCRVRLEAKETGRQEEMCPSALLQSITS